MAGYNPAAPYGQGPGQGQAPPGPSYHNQNPTPQYGDQQNTNMNYTNQTAYGSNNTNTTGTFPPAMTFPPPPPPFNNATAGATGGVPPLPFPDWMEGIQNGQLLQLPLFNGAWFPPFPLPPPPPSMAGLNNSFAFGNNAGVGTTFDPANFPLPPPFPGQMNTGNAATMLPPPPHSQLSRQSSTQNMSAATGTVIPGLALHGQPSSASTGTLPPPSPFRRSKVPSDDVEMSEGEYVSRDNSPSTYAQGAPGMGSQPARGTLGLPKDMRILQNAKDMKNGKGRSSKQRSPRLPPPSDDFGDVSAARTNFSAFPALSRRASEKYNTRETRRPSIDSYRPIYDSAHDIRPELFPNGAGSRRSSFDLNLNRTFSSYYRQLLLQYHLTFN